MTQLWKLLESDKKRRKLHTGSDCTYEAAISTCSNDLPYQYSTDVSLTADALDGVSENSCVSQAPKSLHPSMTPQGTEPLGSHTDWVQCGHCSQTRNPFPDPIPDSLTTSTPQTVVRRSTSRCKAPPAVVKLVLSAPKTPNTAEIDAQDDTDNSSPQQGRSSPLDPSTPATSLDSMRSGKNSVTSSSLAAGVGGHVMEVPSLGSILETPVIKPTIRTVEAAVNTKIYLETYYNCLLQSRVDVRTKRLMKLEQAMDVLRYPQEQRTVLRAKQYAEETSNLRHTRVAKAQQTVLRKNVVEALKGYEILRILGKGSFGVVRLVRARRDHSITTKLLDPFMEQGFHGSACPTATQNTRTSLPCHPAGSRVFAMKVIRKSNMLRNGQEAHIRAERDMLVAAEGSRWIIPLVESFEDYKNLYLVMEFMIGGDFLALLIKEDRLDEDVAKFYIAEMILCLEESHSLGWLHRDVKPDNFLISATGHLKISDFGLAFDGHWSHDQQYWYHQRYSLLEALGINVIGDDIDREDLESASPNAKMAEITSGPREYKARQRHKRPSLAEHHGDRLIDWRNSNSSRFMARSVVGTSQYMAPEVIRGDPYDGRCD